MPARWLLVLNPRAAGGRAGRIADSLRARLAEVLGPVEIEATRAPRDAERIAREAVRAGVENLVVAGGDGTINEVVSGLLGAHLEGYARLAFLPLGTGGDLLRTLGVPRELDTAVARLAEGPGRAVDAGRVRFRDRSGAAAESYFLNVGSVGLSGLVTELVNRAPKTLGPRVSYVSGAVRAMVRFRPEPVRLVLDDHEVHDGPLTLATAANGRYFGGGMRVAPEACVDDGLFDVVVIPGLRRARLLWSFPRIYRGTHLRNPRVRQLRGRRLEATTPATVWIEVDGEPVGTLPATFEVLPKAITVLGTRT